MKLFLSVGAMKAGTTFLYRVLKQHPEIFFTPEKELHYFAHIYGLDRNLAAPLQPAGKSARKLESNFSTQRNVMTGEILSADFRRHRLASVMRKRFSKIQDADELRNIVSWYAERYLRDPVDEHWLTSVFNDCQSEYAADFSNYHALLGDAAWRDIRKNFNDQVKVIYFLRHPIDRLWSHLKFDSEHRGQRINPSDVKPELARRVLKESISAHSNYRAIITSLQRNLRPDQLTVMCFESFLREPDAHLLEIERFLNLPRHNYRFNTARKSNVSSRLMINDTCREILSVGLADQLDYLKNCEFSVPPEYFL